MLGSGLNFEPFGSLSKFAMESPAAVEDELLCLVRRQHHQDLHQYSPPNDQNVNAMKIACKCYENSIINVG